MFSDRYNRSREYSSSESRYLHQTRLDCFKYLIFLNLGMLLDAGNDCLHQLLALTSLARIKAIASPNGFSRTHRYFRVNKTT